MSDVPTPGCGATRHSHLGECVIDPVKLEKSLAVVDKPRVTAERRREIAARASKIAAEKASQPPSTLADVTPGSKDEAKELLARAVSEVCLQSSSLRRLRELLRTENDKTALATWQTVMDFLKDAKTGGGDAKPVQIVFNSHVRRPPKDITPP